MICAHGYEEEERRGGASAMEFMPPDRHRFSQSRPAGQSHHVVHIGRSLSPPVSLHRQVNPARRHVCMLQMIECPLRPLCQTSLYTQLERRAPPPPAPLEVQRIRAGDYAQPDACLGVGRLFRIGQRHR